MFVAISWPQTLISQLFRPGLILRAAPVFTAWLFLHGSHFFLYGIKSPNASL